MFVEWFNFDKVYESHSVLYTSCIIKRITVIDVTFRTPIKLTYYYKKYTATYLIPFDCTNMNSSYFDDAISHEY